MSTFPLRQKLIDIAVTQVGVLEIPRNSNTGPGILKYQRATTLTGTRWPYCAAFVCWCIREWGRDPEVLNALKLTPHTFAAWRPRTAAAYGFHEWATHHDLTTFDENESPGQATLHTGDIVTFDTSHIGLVRTDSPIKQIVYTIEGNTDSAGSRDGGGVYEKTRVRPYLRKVIRLLP